MVIIFLSNITFSILTNTAKISAEYSYKLKLKITIISIHVGDYTI